jgi:diacylglycerol kinase (ATP)
MKRLWRAWISTCSGIAWVLRNEASFQQEFVIFVVGLPLAFLITEQAGLRLALIGSLILMLIVELLNTSLEKLSDHVTPEHSEAIKVVKDLGSAAVFGTFLLTGLVWLYALIEKI